MAGRSIHLTLLLSLLFSVSNPKPCNAARVIIPHKQPKSTIEFIKSSCCSTTYPNLCFNSLSSYASTIQSSSMQLADTALSVSLNSTRSASAAIKQMTTAPGGARMTPREGAAMKDCMENMRDSIMELQDSMAMMGHLGRKDMRFQLNSVQTWVSAALTDVDTCMNGFAEGATDGAVKDAVRGHVVNVAQLTSNALALINRFVSSLQSSSP